MSITNGPNGWPPPSHTHANDPRVFSLVDDAPARTQTPVYNSMTLVPEAPSDIEDDSRRAFFNDLFRRSEARVAQLFCDDGSYNYEAIESFKRPALTPTSLPPPTTDHDPVHEPPRKKVKRVIDEDDYGDDDDEDDEEAEQDAGGNNTQGSPLKLKHVSDGAPQQLLSPSKSGSSPVQSVSSPEKQANKSKEDGAQAQNKTSEDARKELEEARNATEEAAKRSFHTLFYTLENDRTAMLEQQQLEESEKQIQAEMDKNSGGPSQSGASQGQGSLSSANLGASSLTLKHLIARIDLKRSQVKASDAELRTLMNEVRKNRSKWASEENVGQEELYEALEKVLSELKAHTEYSTPFLQRVNKRDAPDYYNFIKHPMDLGTMTKKLKGLQYKSKADFVIDLNFIWDNCLRYNQDMGHPLRRMANGMRKEAEKLIPLIPDLVIRPRAEVEAEERRKQNGGEDDGAEDSDDEPIIASRGRKTTGNKGTNKSRKAPTDQKEDTPGIEQKPLLQLNGVLARVREGSEVGEGSNGFATPPFGGSNTPSGLNGQSGASNADAMDIDGPSMNGMLLGPSLNEAAEQAFEDEEYKIWKQVTKKDRALLAKERFQLFKGNKLNVDEPAILRTKAGMRRYLRSQKEAEAGGLLTQSQGDSSAIAAKEASKTGETLAEGMEAEDERVIPSYYEPQTVLPDIPAKLQWIEDDEGHVINQHEEFIKLVPAEHFQTPQSKLAKRFDGNLRQMQETRKICSKIGVVKQMQLQTQVYQNQFPKYQPDPFYEPEIEPYFISGEGPLMSAGTCRASMQRSVAKIFYHAGFEELQPSALEAITDIAGDYFTKIISTFNTYREAERPSDGARFSTEETVLHTLHENGHDVDQLETYARDDIDRLGTKLGGIHERMKTHLADLLRPALNDTSQDGSGAFNDGSEQFVGGDFADQLGEDFFGFKALGLDLEMGMDMLSVPLHLLQSRVRSQYVSNTQAAGGAVGLSEVFDQLPPPESVTKENIQENIGLVKNFFLAKLHANGDQPLVEDEDLPVKQRRPRPRLGATGKIVSPQKRPPKEQIALAKKKKKLELAAAAAAAEGKAGPNGTPEKNTPMKKLKNLSLAPAMERLDSQGGASQTDKDEVNGMMSPESIER